LGSGPHAHYTRGIDKGPRFLRFAFVARFRSTGASVTPAERQAAHAESIVPADTAASRRRQWRRRQFEDLGRNEREHIALGLWSERTGAGTPAGTECLVSSCRLDSQRAVWNQL